MIGLIKHIMKQEIRDIVEPFLEEQLEQFENVRKGSNISPSMISSAINRLSPDINSVDIKSLPDHYKVYLDIYGSIYGQGYRICGPDERKDQDGNIIMTEDQQIEYIASIQRDFKNICKHFNKQSKAKYWWLIAEIEVSDQSNQYYIDLSVEGKGQIFSMDRMGNSRLFASDFKVFLIKFFESFKFDLKNSSDSDLN